MIARPLRSVQRQRLVVNTGVSVEGGRRITATSGPQAIRIGIVGAGSNTQDRHIPGLVAIDGVDIVAVCNRTASSTEAVARKYHIETTHESWLGLVNDEQVDAVVIGTWPNMHHPVTLAALEAGKHVLCEARMAMNSREAHDMLRASRSRPDLVAQLVPSPLSFGVDATMQRLVAEGFLGTLHAVDVVFRTSDPPDPQLPLHWREDSRLSGNNVMALGIWYETLMRWIGDARSVVAMGSVSAPLRRAAGGPRSVRIPDHLDVLAHMECGAQARFQFSTVTGGNPVNRATLYGSDATIRFEGGQLHVRRRGETAPEPIEIPTDQAGSWRVEQDFVDAIRGRADVTLTDFETGVRYMEFTDAVWESMQRRRVVELPFEGAGRG